MAAMFLPTFHLRLRSSRIASLALPGVLALAFGLAASSQQTAPANPAAEPAATQQPVTTDAYPGATQTPASPAQDATPQQTAPAPATTEGQPPAAAGATEANEGITEDQLRQMLVGKDLYLRGGYLGDSISFTEHGKLSGHAPSGSYTLCGVRIEKST